MIPKHRAKMMQIKTKREKEPRAEARKKQKSK